MTLMSKISFLVLISLFSFSWAFGDCGTANVFALNPGQTFAAMKTRDASHRILVWDVATGKATELADPKIYVQELFFIDDSHLLAVGSKNSYGPLYRIWDFKTGIMTSLKNQTYRDFSDAKTNISQNKRYAVTSSQLAFGGWGYMVVDLESGSDIYTAQYSKGQGQISDDAKTFYYTENYERSCFDGHCAPLSLLQLNAVDVASNRKLFSIPLEAGESDYNSLGWAGDLLLLYNSDGTIFNTKTEEITKTHFALGPLLDWSKDFSIKVSGERSGHFSFSVAGAAPNRIIKFKSPGAKAIVKLNLDNTKIALLTHGSGEINFYDLKTGAMTAAPRCHE